MFHKMRRKNQELTCEENERILNTVSSGVLALYDDNGYPYAVPLNFVYHGNAVYFHCAKEGHKIDAVKNCDKASFCVVAKDAVVAEKFATDYYSVIVFGKVQIISEQEEMRSILRLLNSKLAPDFPKEGELEIEKDINNVCIIKLEAELITGKAAINGIRDSVNQEEK